ncbi:hypothetical protein F66182_14906, partial [Fusarium sp. NRRL 66182]
MVVIKALPGEACKVTFHLPHRINVKPGSHVYAFFPTIAWWMSHPFSVAWADPSTCVTPSSHPTAAWNETYNTYERKNLADNLGLTDLEKQDYMINELRHGNNQKTSLSLVIAARTGMTRKLYNKALA